jgi:hypothetical protein
MSGSRYDEDDPGYTRGDGIFRDAPRARDTDGGSADSGLGDEGKALSVSELLYSSSSYYAIAKPGEYYSSDDDSKLSYFCLTSMRNCTPPCR